MSTNKRPLEVGDLNKIHYVEDPQFSPDGKYVAFVKVTPDATEKGYKRNIWLYPTSGEPAFQLTRGGKDAQPRWSPDGTKLAFMSSRNEKPQIFVLSVSAFGGEARALTSMENGATSPAWSPDGKHIAYLSGANAEERTKEDSDDDNDDDKPKDKLDGKHKKERKDEEEKKRWDPRPMWRIPYRAGTSFLDDRYDQIYVIEVDESKDDIKPRRLTNEDADHEPPKWSHDGTRIYTARTHKPDSDEPWMTSNIYKINVSSGESERITDNDYAVYAPTPSPDGKWIACVRIISMKTDYQGQFILIPTDGSGIRNINKSLDREAIVWAWSPDSKLTFGLASEGNVLPYVYDPVNDELEQLDSGIYEIGGIDISVDGALAMTISTPANPSELYTFDKSSGRKEVTDFNHEFLNEVIVQDVHELRYDSPNGQVQGWYIYPVGYEKGKKYPLALNIHGGPHAMWGASTRSMWHEWQFHAARGYAVFYCNPHGSDGYGEDFLRKLHSAWGDVAMADIMAGVDKFLEMGVADPDKMAITGGSYGGYMTAWIVGHTDRFKSAVSQRGVYNLSSFYGTSDVPILISNEFDSEPWDGFEKWWDHSPLKYAPNITTPLLLIHAENDFRVPIEQAEQLFAWVRRATDTPVHMLRYPREGHELSRSGEPDHRVSRLTEMVNWFDKYVNA